MSAPSAKLFVSVAGHSVWMRIIGRADFSAGVDFKNLANELWQKGFHRFIIDLSECPSMDSTFLGLLAGLGVKANGASTTERSSEIKLLNANARIAELLETLGTLFLFKMSNGETPMPECEEAETQFATKLQLKETCHEAHTTLMELNPANVPKFKEVTKFLAEDLKRLGGKV